MSTLFKSILPIPDQVIVGTGSYTIPANRYGFISMNVSSTAEGHAYKSSGQDQNSSGTGSGSGGGNSACQWLVAGTSITVSASSPTGTSSTSASSSVARETTGYARINLNGTIACAHQSNAGSAQSWAANAASKTARTVHSTSTAWSVSLYKIPINNLPDELIES